MAYSLLFSRLDYCFRRRFIDRLEPAFPPAPVTGGGLDNCHRLFFGIVRVHEPLLVGVVVGIWTLYHSLAPGRAGAPARPTKQRRFTSSRGFKLEPGKAALA